VSAFPLAAKSVIVTGAAGGIGAASAKALVAKGANVTLVDVSEAAIDNALAGLPTGQVMGCVADVTRTDQMEAVVTRRGHRRA
jgi:NAD(P)-dependent dehydrogenase (short-subunit alcohol dehydrogenase family)